MALIYSKIIVKSAADVNEDGKINPLDALLINRRFVGIVKSFKAGDWIYENDTVKVNGGNITCNLVADCVGDVNGSYIPGATRLTGSYINNDAIIYANLGEPIDLPISVTEDVELGAIGLKIISNNLNYKITGVNSDLPKFIFLTTDNCVNIAWSSGNDAVSLKNGQQILTLKIQMPDNSFQSQTMNFQLQLDPESGLADGDANIININILSAPKIVLIDNNNSFSYTCYPNPFTGNTVISYQLPVSSKIIINVYDMLGNLVRELVNESQDKGTIKLNLKLKI